MVDADKSPPVFTDSDIKRPWFCVIPIASGGMILSLACLSGVSYGQSVGQIRKSETTKAVLQSASAGKTAKSDTAKQRKPVRLPGLLVDFENQCLDLDAKVCLDKGFLELIACTRGSKEHESIVTVAARPIHIHTGLLLLGLVNGHPAIQQPVGQNDRRWVDLPPKGDPVQVFLVLKNQRNQVVERPIHEFLEYAAQDSAIADQKHPQGNSRKSKIKLPAFPRSFVFAGSKLVEKGAGPRTYLAETSGNIISISTFGDEVVCLPSMQSRKNGQLSWRIKPGQLPKIGTQLLLRLRPAKQSPSKKPSVSGKEHESKPR